MEDDCNEKVGIHRYQIIALKSTVIRPTVQTAIPTSTTTPHIIISIMHVEHQMTTYAKKCSYNLIMHCTIIHVEASDTTPHPMCHPWCAGTGRLSHTAEWIDWMGSAHTPPCVMMIRPYDQHGWMGYVHVCFHDGWHGGGGGDTRTYMGAVRWKMGESMAIRRASFDWWCGVVG